MRFGTNLASPTGADEAAEKLYKLTTFTEPPLYSPLGKSAAGTMKEAAAGLKSDVKYGREL